VVVLGEIINLSMSFSVSKVTSSIPITVSRMYKDLLVGMGKSSFGFINLKLISGKIDNFLVKG
jgi:hypothetical protein